MVRDTAACKMQQHLQDPHLTVQTNACLYSGALSEWTMTQIPSMFSIPGFSRSNHWSYVKWLNSKGSPWEINSVVHSLAMCTFV